MIKIERLTNKNIGLAFSCAKDADIWGSKYHEYSNQVLINHPDSIISYGITYDNEPAGHSIIIKGNSPFNPVKSEKAAFIHCFYISENFRNENLGTLLLNYIEKDLHNIVSAIFIMSVHSDNSYEEFFYKHGFKNIGKDEYSPLLSKFFSKTEYSVKPPNTCSNKNDALVVNYNPLCPIMFSQYKNALTEIREALPELMIIEHFPDKEDDLCDYGYFGFFLRNTPILINPKKTDELIRMIRNLLFIS